MGIPDYNIFMVCEQLESTALSELPKGYYFRNCKEEELDVWIDIQLDNSGDAPRSLVTDFFDRTYKEKGNLFFVQCVFVCDEKDMPIASCFIWKQHDKYNTVHWFKVLKPYEGKGIGRALLSYVMRPLADDDYPVYLHTQPSSYRAIKLYSDFGFALISKPEFIDERDNELEKSLPILKEYMPKEAFEQLKIIQL